MELKDLTPQIIEEVFWQAVYSGWGSDNVEKQTSAFLSGFKEIAFKSGRFSVLDTYSKTPNTNASAGTTIIWFDDIPVWMMFYGGWYPKRAIPFLKLALQVTAEQKKFIGGRGPAHFEHKDCPGLMYLNKASLDPLTREKKDTFSSFQGCEYIAEDYSRKKVIGSHSYQGMILI